jgi:ABC-2 type transport system ATP-binding protein
VDEGEKFVPQLFSSLTVSIDSVSVQRPTLDDVFMAHTGRTIRDAEATASERSMANPFIQARRGR